MTRKKYPEPKADTQPSKIAEAVAGYTVSPSAAAIKSAAKSRRIAGLEVPDDVWRFAEKHRLIPHLETTIRLVRESFRDVKTIYLTFDPDPEVSSLDGIIIHAKAKGALEELEKQHQAYQLRFIQEVPNDVRHKICLFYY